MLVRGEDGAVEGLAPLRTGDPAPVPLLPVPVVTVAIATVGVLVVAFVTVLLICTFWKLVLYFLELETLIPLALTRPFLVLWNWSVA